MLSGRMVVNFDLLSTLFFSKVPKLLCVSRSAVSNAQTKLDST